MPPLPWLELEPEALAVLLACATALAAAAMSSVLPRWLGSNTICDRDASTFVPAFPGRLTVILTVHRLAAPCCWASIDQVQSDSSSKGASDCEPSGTAPATTSAILAWQS